MKKMFMCIFVFVLAGMCSSLVKAQTPGQSFVDTIAVQAAASAAKLQATMNKAIMSGNRTQVQSLIATDKNRVYMRMPIRGEKWQEYAYCMAARYGKTEILQDMAALVPAILKEAKCAGETVLDVAIQNKQWDTANRLVAKKVPMNDAEEDLYSLVNVKNKTVLAQLIPPVLAANPNLTDGKCWRCPEDWDRADPFYLAALNNNVNFITTLRNEMKKKGKQVESSYTVVDCAHYYRTSWGISQEESEKTREGFVNRVKNSKETKLLAANGVPVNVKVQEIDNESYCY